MAVFEEPFAYVQHNYGVPACMHRRVIVNGRPGIIVKDLGHHIGVNFDEEDPFTVSPCHPTWEIEYGEIGTPRPVKNRRSRERYRRFIESEYAGTFMEFCGWDAFLQKQRKHGYE